MEKFAMSLCILLLFMGCKEQSRENDVAIKSEIKRGYTTERIVDNLSNPWGMTWLPDGTMLITEKRGDILHVKNGKKTKIQNVPEVYNRGQGGLLDIEIHPNYREKPWIYFTYASSEGEGNGGNTKLSRAMLVEGKLVNIQDLYKAYPNTTRGQHFGSRIEFDNEGYVYFSVGDRGERDVNPQDIRRDGGKIYRLYDDGKIPVSNPFVNEMNAKAAIYSYGHRNPQGIAKHPETGEIWIHEHGPKGGDEVNIIKKRANYGWPVISYGVNYSGTKFTEETEREGMEQPLYYWVPSIAPCGMTFVTSDKYPEWKGHLLVGSLKFNYVELLKLDGNKVVGREKIAEDIGRVRNVKQGPDGYIYIAVEGDGIYKVVPN
ncbi:MAG: PQQ-dependent sugar dehydrogenase [Bacteroidia bacterium]|nr:PQQ-dependent sugar dehydrogenase [Bacteroidia bacterium]NNF30119.1 PQQ-dependent sugar dehydrogenase [Flavobacteriaceae bacterium]MBT8274997.1 PQQ-dependent sugar dehydrogenase [Bacteroidia bacterium]NNJ80582.1 PQQ-dependent sugar dehydrogenase [Flavobacteriaceae bacterium]NNK55517.1 PQQ-dependent sugar dehydrogenase [Flavobacteriaceae bacterium]